MSRLFTEGFEFGDNLFWTNGGGDAPTIYGTGSNGGVPGPRSGYFYFRENGVRTNNPYKAVATPVSEFYARFGFACANNSQPYFFRWSNSGGVTLGTLTVNGSGQWSLAIAGGGTVATGVLMMAVNTWYLIEVHVKLAAVGGVVEVRIEGNSIDDINYSGNTAVSGTSASNFLWASNTNNGDGMYLDDLAVNDTNGAQDNAWCGDGHVVCLMPNAAGDVTQMSAYPTGTANFSDLKERGSDGDTSYVWTGVTGTYDLYNLDNTVGLTGSSILRAWPEMRARKTVASVIEILPVLKTGGQEYRDATPIGLMTTYTLCLQGVVQTVNPQTLVAWLYSDLDALQAGAEVVP